MGPRHMASTSINWLRIAISGLVTTLVWTLLSAVLMTFVGNDFMNSLPHPSPGRGLLLYSFGVNLVSCAWAMWLYAAIRPRYGAGPKTALIAESRMPFN